jgi:hypothetical protein
MAEEAYARARTCQYHVKTGGLADVSSTAPVVLEANTRRRIMHQYDVHALTCSEPCHHVVGIVTPRVALKRCRFARVVGRAVTSANSAETDSLAPCAPGHRVRRLFFGLPHNWLINHFFGTLPS